MKKVALLVLTTCLFLILVSCVSGLPQREPTDFRGRYGNLAWTFNKTTGELCISGDGDMKDFSWITTAVGRSESSQIKSLVICQGITSIGAFAFSDCSELERVTIAEGVTEIGESAFRNCVRLTEINVPNSVTRIASNSFANCRSLPELYVGEQVKVIESYAFFNCKSLQKIILSSEVEHIDDYAFFGCNELREVVFSDDLRHIGEYAFFGVGLEKLKLPEGTARIDVYAFSGCKSLEKVELPVSITHMGHSVFANCNSLTEITIPFLGASREDSSSAYLGYAFGAPTDPREQGSVIPPSLRKVTVKGGWTVADYAFSGCEYLSIVEFPGSITRMGHSVFANCNSLTEITIPFLGASREDLSTAYLGYAFGTPTDPLEQSSLVPSSLYKVTVKGGSTVADHAFAGCKDLGIVELPESITSMGRAVFENCNSLSQITLPFLGASREDLSTAYLGYVFGALTDPLEQNAVIPSSLYKVTIKGGWVVADYAFYHCESIRYVDIPRETMRIGRYAFAGCTDLNHVGHMDGVNRIEERAFEGCAKLRRITLSYHLTHLGDGAFSGCASLSMLLSFKFLTSIGNDTFSGCKSLTDVRLSDDLTYIGDRAFQGCEGLIFFTIPGKVTAIGDGAFANCTHLKRITIPNSVTSIGDYAFRGCTNLSEIKLPQNIERIGDGMFDSCRWLSFLIVPDSVTEIGENAFNGCVALTEIVLPASLESVKENAFDQSALRTVYYMGRYDTWTSISIEGKNERLTSSLRYYYSLLRPVSGGDYWRYVNGRPRFW